MSFLVQNIDICVATAYNMSIFTKEGNMYCSKCGAEIADEAVVCTKCGCLVEGKKIELAQAREESGLKKVAEIFMIIATVISGFSLIALAWTLPMTLSYSRKIKNNEPVSLSFKICSLLFVSPIAGILMLCDNAQ